MSGLSVDAYAIKAASDCICVEKEEGEAPATSTDYNANSLPSYFNLADEDLLGAAERSDSEVDPCLLDTSSESMGSSRIARIKQDLASLNVSPEVGATQMTVSQHPQQARMRRSKHQGIVADALGRPGNSGVTW
jgi:hypothetical protein